MSQLERLQAELNKANDARQRIEADYARQVRTNAVVTAASKAGMYDPADAVAMLADVDVDGLSDAIDKLKASKPYLFKSGVPSNLSPPNPSGGAGKPRDQEVLNEIYGIGRKSSIWGGPGGGVVWNTNITE
jgi:hypothetical protein